jgi:hypothetical protein
MKQLIDLLPKERIPNVSHDFVNTLISVENDGYNQALREVKEILSRVVVDEDNLNTLLHKILFPHFAPLSYELLKKDISQAIANNIKDILKVKGE